VFHLAPFNVTDFFPDFFSVIGFVIPHAYRIILYFTRLLYHLFFSSSGKQLYLFIFYTSWPSSDLGHFLSKFRNSIVCLACPSCYGWLFIPTGQPGTVIKRLA